MPATVYLHAKFDDSSFICSRQIIKNVIYASHDLTTPLLRVICHPYAGMSKFHHSSYSCSGDIVGAHLNLNGSWDLT